jgi:hypothetical protein
VFKTNAGERDGVHIRCALQNNKFHAIVQGPDSGPYLPSLEKLFDTTGVVVMGVDPSSGSWLGSVVRYKGNG